MRQNAKMSSIRVSKKLFEIAQAEAGAMHRSLAGQIEYWAELGRAVEALGLSIEDVKRIFYKADVASQDPFLSLVRGGGPAVQEIPGSILLESKRARQALDYDAQRKGLVSPVEMSPFAGAQIKAHIREVPLD